MHKLSNSDFKVSNSELENLLKKTYLELGRLNGLLELLPKKEMLLSPFLVLESVKSSNIESINSTILEQLQIQAKGRKPISAEQKQTENYRLAILAGYDYLTKTGNFDLDLIKLVQKTLEPNLFGIRDQEKVVIANSVTGKVLWSPPVGKILIIELLEDWLVWVNSSNDGLDDLIKVAVLHSHFEAIHPFVDGNGRTGRILIILYLVFKKYISYPCLFISEYILRTRTYYYLHLQEAQSQNSYQGIIQYLVKGICEKSTYNGNMIIAIAKEKELFSQKLKNELPKIHSPQLVEYLFQTPFYSINSLCLDLNLTRNTASKYLRLLQENSFIDLYEDKKSKLFYNPVLLSILS